MREPSTFEQALTYTGMTLPSNFYSFPADVQAYYKLRIITSAFNDDNGTDKFTAEKAVGYPCIDDNGICSEEHGDDNEYIYQFTIKPPVSVFDNTIYHITTKDEPPMLHSLL